MWLDERRWCLFDADDDDDDAWVVLQSVAGKERREGEGSRLLKNDDRFLSVGFLWCYSVALFSREKQTALFYNTLILFGFRIRSATTHSLTHYFSVTPLFFSRNVFTPWIQGDDDNVWLLLTLEDLIALFSFFTTTSIQCKLCCDCRWLFYFNPFLSNSLPSNRLNSVSCFFSLRKSVSCLSVVRRWEIWSFIFKPPFVQHKQARNSCFFTLWLPKGQTWPFKERTEPHNTLSFSLFFLFFSFWESLKD